MIKTNIRPNARGRRLAAAATIAIAMSLSACGKGNDQQMTAASLPALPATLPLDASPSTAWPTAPEVAALPEASAPIRTVRVSSPRDYYGYADAAYDYQEVLGDAPPDYYFDYDGVDPWAWEGYDQSVVFLEPVDDGYRYYYYRPGADEPYFVRDPYYGYGYDDGQLAVIYDSYGAVLPYDDYGARRDYAARYLYRGRELYDASRRDNRRAVSAANWAARSAAISAAQARWSAARARQPQWRDYAGRAGTTQANYWREEAVRRQADTRRFAAWRNDSFRSPPPPRAIPATWSSAKWARDQKRFLPARADRARVANNAPSNRPAAAAAPQGLFGNRQRVEPNRASAPIPPQADRARREAIVANRDRYVPGAGPMRAIREPQRAAGAPGRATPQPQGQPNPPRALRPQGNPDRGQRFAGLRGNGGAPGNAQRFQPRPQPQPRAVTPRPQPQAGRGNDRARFQAPRPQPQRQAVAPRFQPRVNGGGERPHFQPPRPQPQAAPRPQRPQFNGGMRPAPQMNRPSFQPRAPQLARPPAPRPQMARPAPQPRPAPPAAPRGGGGNGGGRGNGGGNDRHGGGHH